MDRKCNFDELNTGDKSKRASTTTDNEQNMLVEDLQSADPAAQTCTMNPPGDEDSDTTDMIDHNNLVLEEEGLSSSEKAMGMLEIIENIAKYLSGKDLANFRLISKTWNTALIPQFKKRHELVRLHESNTCYQWWIPYSTEPYFQNFISQTNNNNVLFTKYYINRISFDKDFIGHFFSSCGKNLTTLQITLSSHTMLNISQFRHIIFNDTPCLKDLAIEDNAGSRENTHLSYATQWIPFWFTRLCNDQFTEEHLGRLTLKKLKLILNPFNDFSNDNSSRFLADIFNAPSMNDLSVNRSSTSDALLALEEKQHLEKLKSLRLSFLSNQELSTLNDLSRRELNKLSLRELKLKLKQFTLHEICESLEEFLRLQSNSLLQLQIKIEQGYYYWDRDADEIEIEDEIQFDFLQPMTNLQTLVLYFQCAPVGQPGIRFNSFLYNFPNLTRLYYLNMIFGYEDPIQAAERERIRWNSHMNNYQPPHLNLKELYVNGINQLDKLFHIEVLFPCLTKLDITLGDLNLLPNIWRLSWNQLKSLWVRWYPMEFEVDNLLADPRILDEYVTGVPAEQHPLVHEMINSGSPLVDLALLKTKPGVNDMKNLHELGLDFGHDGVRLTDISAYYGYGWEANNFRFICITDTDGISQNCRDMIQNKFGSLVNIHYGRMGPRYQIVS